MLALKMHIYTIWLWAVVNTAHAFYDHGGYDFPWSPFQLTPFANCAKEHWYHHSHNVGNFGLYFNFWDRVMGTDTAWTKFQASGGYDAADATKADAAAAGGTEAMKGGQYERALGTAAS